MTLQSALGCAFYDPRVRLFADRRHSSDREARYILYGRSLEARVLMVGFTHRGDRVVFACVHNAGRSQMAAAFFNELADPARASATSAGTQPGDRMHPEVVEAMREVGHDLGGVRPQRLTDELAEQATLLVTMGCGEACPFVPGLDREDWPHPDPKGRPIEVVRAIRDGIRARVAALVAARGWGR